MKTRNDFVSNSSSCSFIIEEPNKFIDMVNAEFDVDDFCNAVDCLNMSITMDVADKATLCRAFGEDSGIYEYDGKVTMSTTLEQLMSLDEEIISKVKQIEFECDDYQIDAVMKLSVLHRALKNVGIKTDNTSSEHPMLFVDDDSQMPTMAKLYSLAFTEK